MPYVYEVFLTFLWIPFTILNRHTRHHTLFTCTSLPVKRFSLQFQDGISNFMPFQAYDIIKYDFSIHDVCRCLLHNFPTWKQGKRREKTSRVIHLMKLKIFVLPMETVSHLYFSSQDEFVRRKRNALVELKTQCAVRGGGWRWHGFIIVTFNLDLQFLWKVNCSKRQIIFRW